MVADKLYLAMLIFFTTGLLSISVTWKNSKLTNYIAHSLAALGSLAATLCAITVLWGRPLHMTLPLSLPFGALNIRVDRLAAFFLLVVGVVGCAASLYAVGYTREYYSRRYGVMAALYNAFLLSMALVLTVSHVAVFIIVWEIMSVVSFLLVNYDHEQEANNRAAFIYIVMTHIGTAFIIMAFMLLAAGSGSMDFMLLKGSAISAATRNIVFLCALLGFGTKAGIMPLHIWLPRAHPAAPSHVSALMSGVMIKTAIYGMSRFFLEFLGVGPAWWGELILVVAVVSCLLGILYALMEHDLKRSLAYSSIENVGIILLGIGAGMVFMSKGATVLAELAWTAAFYHLINHALFKSLLFMGAGAVLQSTHTKNMELLGGLIKKMPYTALFFLIGAMSISALPPLNGFVGEWLTFQALFSLPLAITGTTGKIFGALLMAGLGLTGALAAASFVRAFGVTFLAKPRSAHAEHAHEVPASMLIPMGGLVGLCILLGVVPQGMTGILRGTLADFISPRTAQFAINGLTVAPSGAISIPVVIILLLVGLAAAVVLYRLFGKPQTVVGETWTCGIVPTARMQYTATGFSKPIRMAFRNILRGQRETLVDSAHTNQYFGRQLSYRISIRYVVTDGLYRPLHDRLIKAARFMKTIQAGSVQLYVGYILTVTIVVLIMSVRW